MQDRRLVAQPGALQLHLICRTQSFTELLPPQAVQSVHSSTAVAWSAPPCLSSRATDGSNIQVCVIRCHPVAIVHASSEHSAACVIQVHLLGERQCRLYARCRCSPCLMQLQLHSITMCTPEFESSVLAPPRRHSSCGAAGGCRTRHRRQ